MIKAQDSSNTRFYLGGTFGAANYTIQENTIPVTQYRKSNVYIGLNGTFYFKNDFFVKSGIYVTGFKSPFKDSLSTYDEFLQIPILMPLISQNLGKGSAKITFGPEISILMRQGSAKINEESYEIQSNVFGDFMKFGISSEIAFYLNNEKSFQSFGFRVSADFASIRMGSNDLVIDNAYTSLSLFVNLNKRFTKKLPWP